MKKKSVVLVGAVILLLLIFGIPFEDKSDNMSFEEHLKNLKSSDESIRLSAISELTSMGDKINPNLLTAIEEDENVLFKISVIQILGDIKNLSSINMFIKYLNHDNWRVRFFSAESLGRLNTSHAIIPLKNLIESEKNRNVILVSLLSLNKIDEFEDIEFLKSLLKNGYKFEDVIIIKEIKRLINEIELSNKISK